ncbi:hypothetical protein TGGT1_411460 [Toxoplasma gondii GT1]|uniref:Uncharacterized protein n=1 Tax=Toxoplasma gondii (strain ATCC 50853 / GT1) TaxID=507601 RepID=S7VNG0_TOXGG|nr:hypothetical protein TGGT1_411460 [Toxoplasma gondii GT1]
MVNQQNAPRSVNSPSRPAHAIPHLLSYSIHARPVPSDMLLARSGAPPISAEQPSPSRSTRPPPSQQVLPQQSEHLLYLFIALRIRPASPMLLPTHGSAFHLQTPPARHSPDPQPSRLAVPIPPLPPHFAQPPPSSNIDLPPKCVTLTTDPHNSRNHSAAPQQLATTS